MIRYILPFVLLFAVVAAPGFVRAEDTPPPVAGAAEAKPESDASPGTLEAEEAAGAKKAAAVAAEAEVPKEVQAHQKAAEDVFKLTKEIAENITPEEQKHFFLLYNNYNLIGTVKMVQGDVGNAVAACGKGNADMKEGLDKKFADWNGAVNPVMKEAEANVENMTIAQDYAKPAQIKKLFKGLDKTRDLANKQIEKTPVTSKEACEYMQDKMSDTQENFVRLLRSTLVSAPQVLPASGDEPAPEEKKAEEPKPEDAAK